MSIRREIVATSAFFVVAGLAGRARADDTALVTTVDGTSTLSGQICDVSGDGRYVLFTSYSSSYVPNDTNGQPDLFVRDMQTGAVERVNVASDGSEDPVGGKGSLMQGTISADGQLVAFMTYGVLDSADNSDEDVYLRDRAAGTTTLVSRSPPVVGAYRDSFDAQISRDGAFVVFTSIVTNLVPNDTNGKPDIFEWERATGVITRVSTDSAGKQINGISFENPRVSGDGKVVTFGELLIRGDQGRYLGLYAKDLNTGTLDLVDAGGTGVALSSDGRFVLYNTVHQHDPSDPTFYFDGFLLDRQDGTRDQVTYGTGLRVLESSAPATGMSDDARRIAFTSSDDAMSDQGPGPVDCYVLDLDTEVALRVSVGPDDQRAQKDCMGGPLSADGHVASLSTYSDSLWPGDVNLNEDSFLRDLSAVPAAWNNYGAGFAGRYGIPALTLSALPRRATTVDLDIGNSSGLYTVAVLFVGLQSQSLPTSFGGTLLVDPFTSLSIALTPWDNTQTMTIPTGGDLPGLHVYLQALELDPGAAEGVSFTPGLDMTIGD
jgi:Tol biopolymer transport system component